MGDEANHANRSGGGGPQLGPYQLGAELGRGGMGAVYRAVDMRSGEEVAVKVLLSDAELEDYERFRREAELVWRLQHPHVARVRALDTALRGNRELRYLVLDLYPGGSLADRLRRGPLPIDEALAITHKLAGALAHAHARGVIHRDLKPGNVLFDAAGEPYLSDFGLARGTLNGRLTNTGAILGTPAFMAPEQVLDSKRADARSDVYGLGAILYALLSGRAPVESSVGGLAAAVAAVEEEAPALRSLRPEVSPSLERLVHQAMAKDRDERVRDMEVFALGLAEEREALARPPVTSRRSPLHLVFGAALVLLFVLAGLASSRLRSEPERSTPSPSLAPLLPADTLGGALRPEAWDGQVIVGTWWLADAGGALALIDLYLELALSEDGLRATVRRVRANRNSGDIAEREVEAWDSLLREDLARVHGNVITLRADLQRGRVSEVEGLSGFASVLRHVLPEAFHTPIEALCDPQRFRRDLVELLALPLRDGFRPGGARVKEGRLQWACLAPRGPSEEVLCWRATPTRLLEGVQNFASLFPKEGSDLPEVATLNEIDDPYVRTLPANGLLELPEPGLERPPEGVKPSLLAIGSVFVLRRPWSTCLGSLRAAPVLAFGYEVVDGWRRIEWGPVSGWVRAKDVQPAPAGVWHQSHVEITVKTSLNVRKEPSASSDATILTAVRNGQRFPVMRWGGDRKRWGLILFAGNKAGWVASRDRSGALLKVRKP
ncbi:MAG TPA: hypothetical protein DEA08_31355 [Planctomycetes bacterium]|nr:hypothetical protein [Planctomycetota bacterium]